ncbi:MAG: AIPR family protein [Campylobacteraceae bacterium]|jgi:hypothetical protein|nr:AIPR family protein [Campylobacteraceae bacterium]
MNEIEKFYQQLIQEIVALQAGSEEGDTQEQTFTRIAVDMLTEAGETENADVVYDEKDTGKRGQHKINAYAVADNYETIDLFISIFQNNDNIGNITKTEIDRAVTRISNFFRKATEKEYFNEIEESSPIFEFANTLANYDELKENLVRVNAIILTNGEYKSELPQSEKISGYSIFYRIIDIKYLYQISEQSRVPIEIDFNDFEGENFKIPCLSANSQNTDYRAYIAIISGTCLAKLYERYGERLLEQNVRSFLQFAGKINKGIRDTIRNEPQMFFAYNNGIAATADHIELDETNHYIKKISNLQIVNGGQTTASIFNTVRQYKNDVDISKIFVQVKFSIIENPEQYAEIVSRISRYANTQNKVNDADFSANNSTLIAFEKLSRYILSPVTPQNNLQTYWFFERAKGQYKTLRSRDGYTISRRNAFDKKYPKNQMFAKVDLAKFINSYQEVWDSKKLVIGPHIAVRGNEKNYAKFINNNLPDEKKINSIYFEDAIAKCILFKTAEKRYGTKKNDYNIGEMRQSVVPYTLSLINILTDNKLDLYKIWKNQKISDMLSDFIYSLMKKVNKFILDNSPSSHYIEWTKKEECWNAVKNNTWNVNINDIKADLIDENNPPKRNIGIDISEEEIAQNKEIVKSIPSALWNKIRIWGKESGYFDITRQNIVSNIAYNLRQNRPLTNEEYKKGVELLDIVAKRNEELLQKALEFEGKWVAMEKVKMSDEAKDNLISGLMRKMITFNYDRNILTEEENDFLYDILNEKQKRNSDETERIANILDKLKKKGFKV